MNIVFKNDTLFVDVDENENINEMKRRVYSIMDGFNISNVVINAGGIRKSNKKLLDNFMEEYKENYNGNISIK